MPGNQSQCHIDARRGDHVTFFDDVLIVNHIDSREQLSHLIQDTPVGRRTLTFQQAGFAQEQ
jgi:hypothetical protein